MAQTSSWLGTCGHADVFFLTKVLGSGFPPVVGLVARRSPVRATRMLQGHGHLRPKQNPRKKLNPGFCRGWLKLVLSHAAPSSAPLVQWSLDHALLHEMDTSSPYSGPTQCPYSARTVPIQCPYSARTVPDQGFILSFAGENVCAIRKRSNLFHFFERTHGWRISWICMFYH